MLDETEIKKCMDVIAEKEGMPSEAAALFVHIAVSLGTIAAALQHMAVNHEA